MSSEAQALSERYTVIPKSGTFRELSRHLEHIFGRLNCRILQLLPVHPIPTEYGRMGVYGSPFAALDYFSVDPALAEFDERATPLEQFGELIAAVHRYGGRLFMDIPVNHTGWASRTMTEHPEYFVREADGKFRSPGAWGVVWADLCQLNFDRGELRELLTDIFLFWCRRGVDGFRCDAGYMVPEPVWRYAVSRVRQEFPDTVFLLEGLGGPLKQQEKLLRDCDLDWAYSELFQNYDRDAVSAYFPYMDKVSCTCGKLISFAETHDNLRLAASGRTYARLRFLVTSLLATGGFGFANGAEFLATQKIDVHGRGALNFNAADNLVELISKLNTLHRYHPAFRSDAEVTLIQRRGGNVLAARRRTGRAEETLLILLNLDCQHPSTVHFDTEGLPRHFGRDLLSGKTFSWPVDSGEGVCDLAPGDGCCLAFDNFDITADHGADYAETLAADAMAKRAAAKYLPLEKAANSKGADLLKDPRGFACRLTGRRVSPAVEFRLDAGDLHREVPITSDELLLITDAAPFEVQIVAPDGTVLASERSLPGDFEHLALLALPENASAVDRVCRLKFRRFAENGAIGSGQGCLRQLPAVPDATVSFAPAPEIRQECYAFGSDRQGGYTLVPARWGNVRSKYDALLAVNSETGHPADRRVLWSCCRAYLVSNDFSQVLDGAGMTEFVGSPDNRARWTFQLPIGQGQLAKIELELRHAIDTGAVQLVFRRTDSGGNPAVLILRPELEDRINHELTRAYCGPETDFPRSVSSGADFFRFHRPGLTLQLKVSQGVYVPEGEWYYMRDLPFEADYGQDHHTDRYSPGYFKLPLEPHSEAVLTAELLSEKAKTPLWPTMPLLPKYRVEEFSGAALTRFVVDRDRLKSVIAGYPWFLDWGRDTLIVLRGLLAKPEFFGICRDILLEFAGFESNGTIPNVIRGAEVSNRDTSDAPLYLIIGFRDYISKTSDRKILSHRCRDGRTVKEILDSIIAHYISGTPNGIKMDPDSALVYSSPHFSWMDTNFPAGTPRGGYPIEIQSLWYAALKFMGRKELAAQVRHSVEQLYFASGSISDCLHGEPGTPAAQAVADDHLRPNALTAITLGLVTDKQLQRRILEACRRLVVPGGIRTLDDVPVRYQLPVYRDGQLLNDPQRPYRGGYHGPEDTSRKVAYHNGTVWCWPFPAYCEALVICGGKAEKPRALSLLLSMKRYFEVGIPGQLPEVADGDAPHRPGGCAAQAWSLSEFVRVYELLR